MILLRPSKMLWCDWVVSLMPIIIGAVASWSLRTTTPLYSFWCLGLIVVGYLLFANFRLYFITKEGKGLFLQKIHLDLAKSKNEHILIKLEKPSIPKRLVLIFDSNLDDFEGVIKLKVGEKHVVLFDISPRKKDAFFLENGRHRSRPNVLVASYDGKSPPVQNMELDFEMQKAGTVVNSNKLGGLCTVKVLVRGI